MITVDVDTTKLNEALATLSVVLGKDMVTILKEEHLRLTKTIINFTPPTPKTGAKQIGEFAIKKDLYSLISEASPELIDRVGSKHGLRNIDDWGTAANGDRYRILWENLDPTGTRLADLHNQYRNPRTGRPRRRKSVDGEWRARIVVEKGQREPYIKLVQANVGRWKAKWAYGAAQLGGRFPAWITRHFGYVANRSLFRFDLSSENPYIAFGGSGSNFRKNIAAIKGAITFRKDAIMRRAGLAIRNYSKDWASGMKAQTAAHKSRAESEEEDVD